MSTQLTRAFVLKKYVLPFWLVKWACVFAFFISFTNGALAQPLSLEKALQLAQQRSQAVLAQEAAAQASQEMAVRANQLPDPVLQLSLDNLPVNDSMAYSLTEDFMTMRSIGFSQTFTGEKKRRARATVYQHQAHSAQLAQELTIIDLRRETALAWFDCFYQQQMLLLLEHQQQEAKLLVDGAEASYRAGQGAQSDVFLARTAVAEIQDRLQQTQARLENAKTTLTRWVGESADAALDGPPDITKPPINRHHLTRQIKVHPDIAVMIAEEAVARAEADAARQEKQADWTWSVKYSERSAKFSDMVSIGVSVPLQWNQENREDRVVAAKLAKAEQVRAEREEMIREHIAETQRWLETWQSNLIRLSDYEKTLIPLSIQRTEASLGEYRGGSAALVDVLDARKMEIVTRIEKLRIEMETAALWTALEYLTIHDTPHQDNEASTSPSSHLLDTKE